MSPDVLPHHKMHKRVRVLLKAPAKDEPSALKEALPYASKYLDGFGVTIYWRTEEVSLTHITIEALLLVVD